MSGINLWLEFIFEISLQIGGFVSIFLWLFFAVELKTFSISMENLDVHFLAKKTTREFLEIEMPWKLLSTAEITKLLLRKHEQISQKHKN